MTERIAKTYCTAATLAGKQCRAVGRWFATGGSDFLCKRHASEHALLRDDPRIVHSLTGRIVYVDPADLPIGARHRGDTSLPVGLDAIVAELDVARTARDIDRCRAAIVDQIPVLKDERLGLKPPLRDAWHRAKARVQRLQGRHA